VIQEESHIIFYVQNGHRVLQICSTSSFLIGFHKKITQTVL